MIIKNELLDPLTIFFDWRWIRNNLRNFY